MLVHANVADPNEAAYEGMAVFDGMGPAAGRKRRAGKKTTKKTTKKATKKVAKKTTSKKTTKKTPRSTLGDANKKTTRRGGGR